MTLLEAFRADPISTRQQLRELPHFRGPFISEVFALVVFLSDGLLHVSESTTQQQQHESDARKFFQIAAQLPQELQMVLCNRVFGSGKDLVLTKHSEPAFKKLTKQLFLMNTMSVRRNHQGTFGVGLGVRLGAVVLGGLVLAAFLLRRR